MWMYECSASHRFLKQIWLIHHPILSVNNFDGMSWPYLRKQKTMKTYSKQFFGFELLISGVYPSSLNKQGPGKSLMSLIHVNGQIYRSTPSQLALRIHNGSRWLSRLKYGKFQGSTNYQVKVLQILIHFRSVENQHLSVSRWIWIDS
jgi:hypothetical protein